MLHRKLYKIYKRKLKIEQRKLSKSFKKAKKNSQKIITNLSKNHEKIAIEDLNVKGMSKNHQLASAILDDGFYEFGRQLTYKCEWYGSKNEEGQRFECKYKSC